jgi:error-prone DNA polymerase
MSAPSDYVELHARSAFSFLRGGSVPEHLVRGAADLDLPALAICDRLGVYGAPRFHAAAADAGVRPIHGAELALEDGSTLPVLVENRTGYANLCQLLTRAHLRAPKGEGVIRWDELPEFADGLVALTGDDEGPLVRALLARRSPIDPGPTPASHRPSLNGHGDSRGHVDDGDGAPLVLARLIRAFGPRNVFVELQRHHRRGEERVVSALVDLAHAHDLPLLATNGVQHASPEGRQVTDLFTCLRHHLTLDAAGARLSSNDERHLKSPGRMGALFADVPEAIGNTARLADRLRFELTDLGYEFPKFPVGPGETMEGALRAWTDRGARERYPGGVPEKVRGLLEKELALIGKLGFAGYFLIVADLCRYCRENRIMVQGRGSAANSAVCFCLGITAVDPVKFNVLFERFLSENRKGWPDIDLDLPSGDRRERVIQEVYRRYGPHGAAMTGTIISYRGRSTAREVGKVLGLPGDILERFSNLFGHGDFPDTMELYDRMQSAGLALQHPRARAFAALYRQVSALPRHLGQHSGGMIICQGLLNRFVPLENASMPGRVVAQWDKDDCADLGIIKVDLLGLGMMAALQDCVTLTAQQGHPVDLAQLPENDPKSFELMRRADTIGVFQVESRAQMATLPRMRPNKFYDLVIEVAIIRPGPIQGDLAHPFLRRRNGEEAVTYYAPQLEPILERTLGVPLFQEQMLEMAMIMAKFSGDEAEELRRAMSFQRSDERMTRAKDRLRSAMERAGVAREVAERIVQAVGSFALYGFPESHAISFAHLAYASAYLKAHRPTEFFCALLNNQPMGFYSPATLVKDAKRHGVQTRHVCVQRSHWETLIEPRDSRDPGAGPGKTADTGSLATADVTLHDRDHNPATPPPGPPALRLGFRQVQGLRHERVKAMLNERARQPFASMDDFKRRALFNKDELRALAEIGALNCFAPHRRAALWETERTLRRDDLFAEPPPDRIAPAGETGAAGPGPGSVTAETAEAARSTPDQATASPLAPMNPLERLRADYDGLRLTTGPHPMAMMRPRLTNAWRAGDLAQVRNGQIISVAGQVICRQRPGTAKGVCFISLEDETGISNVIVWPDLFEAQRLKITMEPFLMVEGQAQAKDGTIHIVARRIERLDFTGLSTAASHDFS